MEVSKSCRDENDDYYEYDGKLAMLLPSTSPVATRGKTGWNPRPKCHNLVIAESTTLSRNMGSLRTLTLDENSLP
jgi:hypothetical protein